MPEIGGASAPPPGDIQGSLQPAAPGKLYPLIDSMNSWLGLVWANCPGDRRKAGGQTGRFPGFKPSLHLGRWLYIPFHKMLTAALTRKEGSLMPRVLQIRILADSSMSS